MDKRTCGWLALTTSHKDPSKVLGQQNHFYADTIITYSVCRKKPCHLFHLVDDTRFRDLFRFPVYISSSTTSFPLFFSKAQMNFMEFNIYLIVNSLKLSTFFFGRTLGLTCPLILDHQFSNFSVDK